MVKLVNEDKWAPLIGKLFLSFGSIEMLVQKCIKNWTNDVIFEHIKKDNLSKKIKLLIALVEHFDYSEKNKTAFIESLKSAQKLLEIRNTIAHSPLKLVLFQETGDFIEAITSSTNDAHIIEFQELENYVKEVDCTYENILTTTVNFKIEKIDFTKLNEMKGLKGA